MTNLTVLDKAVRELSPGDLWTLLVWGRTYGPEMTERYWKCTADCIRARYRKIVAMADKPLT